MGFVRIGLALSVLRLLAGIEPVEGQAQPKRRIEVVGSVGYLHSGDYFTGPASTSLNNGDAASVGLQVQLPLYRWLGLVIAASHAEPDWKLNGVPLLGTLTLPGASLWFGDAALRGSLPLGRSAQPTYLFGQIGAGAVRYAVSTSILGNRLEDHATNFAFALGAGIGIPIAGRIGAELMGKDYIASFKSVRDLEALGVQGQRAHTVLATAGLRVSF
jgi:hypothetical protein